MAIHADRPLELLLLASTRVLLGLRKLYLSSSSRGGGGCNLQFDAWQMTSTILPPALQVTSWTTTVDESSVEVIFEGTQAS
ncbi:MAG: hypothetical protein PSV46_16085, partial [Reyranella sp.]|nr:hypothetical protein [Reyranella sp.]